MISSWYISFRGLFKAKEILVDAIVVTLFNPLLRTFYKDISLKINVLTRLGFELAYIRHRSPALKPPRHGDSSKQRSVERKIKSTKEKKKERKELSREKKERKRKVDVGK